MVRTPKKKQFCLLYNIIRFDKTVGNNCEKYNVPIKQRTYSINTGTEKYVTECIEAIEEDAMVE